MKHTGCVHMDPSTVTNVALRADFDALPVEELADVPFKSTVV